MMDDGDNYCDLATKLIPNPRGLSSGIGTGYQGGGLKYPPPLTYTLAFSADFVGDEESFQDACV